MNTKGKFIVFEGLDGSGKTTQMQMLANRMQAEGLGGRVYLTREPSDGEVGRLIRAALRGETPLEENTMALLFAADRMEHIQKEVLPRINAGETVLCDRYYFSNFAYQSGAIPLETLLQYNAAAMQLLRPNATLYLDLTPEACVRRMAKREKSERYEELEILQRVRGAYMEAFEKLGQSHVILPVQPEEEKEATAEKIWCALKNAGIFTA